MHRITIIDNFIDGKDAKTLISEINNPSEKNPYPEYYSERYGGTALPYNKTVNDIMIKYGHKSNEVHRSYNGFISPIYVFKGFGSKWSVGEFGETHIDAQGPEPFIEFSTVIYLNDNYEGGEIFFPNQRLVYKPKAFSAVFFPSSGSEYIHGILPVIQGNRYTALFMHTSQPHHSDPDYHPGLTSSDWEAMLFDQEIRGRL